MYADANGIRFHYKIDGREGAPWVTFITGIANDMTMWDSQIGALESDFRILRIDSRGHGGTQATEGDTSLAQTARDAGVQSTPTIFVNGKLIGSLRTYEDYKRVIDDELAGAN